MAKSKLPNVSELTGKIVRINEYGLEMLRLENPGEEDFINNNIPRLKFEVTSVTNPIKIYGKVVYNVGIKLAEGNGIIPFGGRVDFSELDTDHIELISDKEEKQMTKKEEVQLPFQVQQEAFVGVDYSQYEKITVLVDADIVAYRVAAMADGRHYTIKGVYEGGQVLKQFKYKKDANRYADQYSLPASDIKLKFDPEPVDKALLSVDVLINTIKESYISRGFNPEMHFFISGAKNFRYALSPDYKANRKNVRRPAHLVACKEHIMSKYKALRHSLYEADDLIAMAATKIQKNASVAEMTRETPIISIATCDKDFIQLAHHSVEFYDFTNDSVSTPGSFQGLLYFYKQILTGDKSDNIKGLKGVGPQTAIKILKGCECEEDLAKAVLAEYQTRNDTDDRQTELDVTLAGKLLHLVREHGAKWVCPAV